MKKITFIACLCWLVTSFGLLNAQTMTFDTGASETGFTFSQWQVITPGTIAPVSTTIPAVITKDTGTWNATSIDITFAGGNTYTVTSNLGDTQSFTTNIGTI